MHKRITFRHMDTTEAIERYANEQLAKIEHFLENEPTPIYINLTFEPSKVREHHRIELQIKSPHYDLFTHYEHEGANFYEALDHVVDTMYHKLHEEKRKLDDDKKMVGRHEEFKKQR
jgi:ribosomal subunit interface protein